MRSAVIIAVLFLVASANGLTFSRLKAARQAALQLQQASVEFGLRTAVETPYPGCSEIGAERCKLLADGTDAANVKLPRMIAHLTANGADAQFKAAFGTASVADVMTCLNAMALPSNQLVLWNALSNRNGSAYRDGDPLFAGLGIVTGTKKLLVGAGAYGKTASEMGEQLIHEASHAFCGTVDIHNGLNGYKDSGHFDTCKSATNADSYRVYAERVAR